MAHHLFRLASVLSLREAQLTEKASEVARFETEVRSLETARDRVEGARLAIQETVVTRLSVSAGDLRDAAEYLDVLELQHARLRDRESAARGDLGDARSGLLERHQAVSVLRRLRDRQDEARSLEDQRTEQRALDEVAGAGFYRSHRQ